MKHIIAIALVTLASVSTLFAQKTGTTWFASFNTIGLNKGFSIHFDGQWRSGDHYSKMLTLLLRPGLNYKVSDKLTVTAGYGLISGRRTISGISGYAPEHRIWQQAVYTHPLLNSSLAHRFRLEQRFISKSSVSTDQLVNDGNIYANRFRYFFRTVFPFRSGKGFSKGAFWAIQNEIMFNIGNNSGVNGRSFDQNRAYTAFGYRFGKKFDLEAGYMNQYIQGRGAAFTNNHVIQLATYTRL